MSEVANSRAAAGFFDHSARTYDAEFSRSLLGQDLRAIVRERLASHFMPGSRVLELNCGTGEDAVWLARRGVRVLATDISGAMLDATSRKARAEGVDSMIQIRRMDMAQPDPEFAGMRFDGILSNFGGVNCVADLTPLASTLAQCVPQGGVLIVVFMGRHCAWEIAWHCAHFRPTAAFRRLGRGGTQAAYGAEVVRVWYPSVGSLSRTLEPWFEKRRVAGLGTFLPPTYLASLVYRRPKLHRVLLCLERSLCARFPFNRTGDHTICEYRRTGEIFSHAC